MTTERIRFLLNDTYQEIQWATPIGCVEFKSETTTRPHYYYTIVYAYINGELVTDLMDFDNLQGRKRLIKKVNQLIKGSLNNY